MACTRADLRGKKKIPWVIGRTRDWFAEGSACVWAVDVLGKPDGTGDADLLVMLTLAGVV